MSEDIRWTKTVTKQQERRLVVRVTSLDDGCCENIEELTDEDLAEFRGDFLEKHMAMVRDRDAWLARATAAEMAFIEVHKTLDPTSSRRTWTPQQRREAVREMLATLDAPEVK